MMPMTLTEKILASHAGRDHVKPGDNIWIDVDVLMTHDVCGPGTIGIFKQHFGKDAKVWDRDKVVVDGLAGEVAGRRQPRRPGRWRGAVQQRSPGGRRFRVRRACRSHGSSAPSAGGSGS